MRAARILISLMALVVLGNVLGGCQGGDISTQEAAKSQQSRDEMNKAQGTAEER